MTTSTSFNTLVASYTVACDATLDSLFATQSMSRTCVGEGTAIHTLADGRVLCEFHHAWDSTIPVEAYFADIVLCCHPEWLPSTLRDRHPTPEGYTGEVAVAVSGGLGDPVTVNLYIH